MTTAPTNQEPTMTSTNPTADEFLQAIEYQISEAKRELANLVIRRARMTDPLDIATYAREVAYQQGRQVSAETIRAAAEALHADSHPGVLGTYASRIRQLEGGR